MAGIRANFADTLDPAIRTVFFDRYQLEPEVRPQIFVEETSDRNIEEDSGITGLGLLTETAELGALDYEDALQLYKTTYTHKKYTKGIKISVELVEDDQKNTIRRLPDALARSVVRTNEFYGASVFNNGFNTSYTSYGDGKPLFSTLHSRVDGGTAQSNASATGVTLTDPNLETARVAFRKQLDDKGMKVMTTPKTLLVPIDLGKTAKIIVNSNLRSNVADNDVNIYNGMFNIVEWEFITSTTAWFLLGSKGDHQVKWNWRVRPQFKQDNSFDADAALWKVRERFSYGWSDWRSTWGSKGDAGAYSS